MKSRGLVFFVLGTAVGLTVGFALGILSVRKARDLVGSVFNAERGADVDHTTALDRPAFHLEYPGNWRIDTSDSDYDPDHLFMIDSPGHSFVLFTVAEGDLDPARALEAHVSNMTGKVMRDAARTPFAHWGAYDGVGALLAGKNLGITPATVRVFAFRTGNRTYTVTESTFDEDRPKVSPGFSLVERTFRANAN